MEKLTLIISLIGALAWFAPWIYDKLTKTDLQIKLISQYGSIGSVNTPDIKITMGNLYLMKFAIVAKNKGFDYKDIDIKIKLPSINESIKGKIYTARFSYYTLIESGQPVLKQLLISQNEELIYNCYIEKDKPLIGFIAFAIDTAIDENYEKLEINFVGFDNKKITKEILNTDVKGSKLFYDDKIWKDIPNTIK